MKNSEKEKILKIIYETYPQLEYYSCGLDDGTYSSAMEALNKIEKIIKEGDKDE